MRTLLVALLLSVCAFPAGAFPLETWTTPFPPNSCLPVTQRPIIFSGPYCDGTTCPPDALAPCTNSYASQYGQAGFPAGFQRQSYLVSFQGQAASARIEGGRLIVDSSESWDQHVQIYYLNHAEPNVNFTALGVEAFRFEIQGTMSEAQPLWFQVLLFDGLNGIAQAKGKVSATGIVTVPLSSFVLLHNFRFDHVHEYSFQIGDCLDEVCIGPQGPISYSVGPLEYVSSSTPAEPTSWGRVKSLYR